MSQSASEHAVHFVTPPLRSGRPYENPALPELPNLWSLDHPDTAPIPDEAACRALWTRYAMFSHIERHSECVAGMAEALARRAVETGATRHPELVALSLAAGLLHDMMNGIAFVIQPKNIARMKKDLPILFVSAAAPSTTLFAFFGALLAVCLSLGLTALSPVRDHSSIVLAGIAVHALAQTVLMLLKLMADPEKQLASIEYWIMGSLSGVTASKIPFPVVIILISSALVFLLHRHLLALSVREDEARMLGVSVRKTRFFVLFLATLTVAAAVSVTGLISFVGLLAPHTARLLTGHNRKSACFLSGLIGSFLLLTADILAKSLAAVELPVSIFTSLLGAPFLIYLILSERRR